MLQKVLKVFDVRLRLARAPICSHFLVLHLARECVVCNPLLFHDSLFNVLAELRASLQVFGLKVRVCMECALHQKLWPIQSGAHGALRILPVKHITELVTKLPIAHEDVLPDSERKLSE